MSWKIINSKGETVASGSDNQEPPSYPESGYKFIRDSKILISDPVSDQNKAMSVIQKFLNRFAKLSSIERLK